MTGQQEVWLIGAVIAAAALISEFWSGESFIGWTATIRRALAPRAYWISMLIKVGLVAATIWVFFAKTNGRG